MALAPDAYLQLDDVVVTVRPVPGFGPVATYGVVTQVRARHEGASFGSDVFLIADGVLPAQVQEIAEITTTRVEPECYVPPLPGAAVRRATGEERAQALYFDRMERTVPVGLGRDGEPVYVNLDFLDGTRGGHVSISGVSGVATKTSFALFLLYSIFRSGVLGRRSVNAKALVFSVKGEDLLFLDQHNTRLDDAERARYARLGLRADRFDSVGFFAPPTPDDPSGRPHVTGRTSGVTAFWWTLAEFCAGELLPYVFADAEDERNQYTTVIHQVAARLRREATAVGDGAVSIEGRVLRSYPELVELISDRLADEEARRDWAGPVTGTGTINAFLRRLRSSVKPLRTLLRGDLADLATRRVSTENQQVTVVDLHNLPERAQRFVVGVVLAAETARKEAAGPGGLLFTMIDELNKYAPREGVEPDQGGAARHRRARPVAGHHPDRRPADGQRGGAADRLQLLDQGGRPARPGRGRARPEYGFLPATQRARATLAKPGTMFVSQPEIPVPLAVEFPFPAWATRQSEAGADPGRASGNGAARRDPFARLPAVPGRRRPVLSRSVTRSGVSAPAKLPLPPRPSDVTVLPSSANALIARSIECPGDVTHHTPLGAQLMKSAYRVLAYLIALEVLVQAGAIAYALSGLGAWIQSGGVLDKAAMESETTEFPGVGGFMVHGINGQMIVPLIALLLLVVAFFAKVRGGVQLAAMVLGGVVVQVALGIFGHGHAGARAGARHAGHRDLRGRDGRRPAGGAARPTRPPTPTGAPPASARPPGAAPACRPGRRRPAAPGPCWRWPPPSRCWPRSAGSGRPACCPTSYSVHGHGAGRRGSTGPAPAAHQHGAAPAVGVDQLVADDGPADVAVTLVARAARLPLRGRVRRLHAQRQLARPGARAPSSGSWSRSGWSTSRCRPGSPCTGTAWTCRTPTTGSPGSPRTRCRPAASTPTGSGRGRSGRSGTTRTRWPTSRWRAACSARW